MAQTQRKCHLIDRGEEVCCVTTEQGDMCDNLYSCEPVNSASPSKAIKDVKQHCKCTY